jgi:hypothetical protein
MSRSGGTSKRMATEAGDLLRESPSKKVRSVAGSDLVQRRRHRRTTRRSSRR